MIPTRALWSIARRWERSAGTSPRPAVSRPTPASTRRAARRRSRAPGAAGRSPSSRATTGRSSASAARRARRATRTSDADGERVAMCEGPGHASCATPGRKRCEGNTLVECETHGHFAHEHAVDCATTGLTCSLAFGSAACLTSAAPAVVAGPPDYVRGQRPHLLRCRAARRRRLRRDRPRPVRGGRPRPGRHVPAVSRGGALTHAPAHRPMGPRQDLPAHGVRHAARHRQDRARTARREANEPRSLHAPARDGAGRRVRSHPVWITRADEATARGQAPPRRHPVGQLHAQAEPAEPPPPPLPRREGSTRLQAPGAPPGPPQGYAREPRRLGCPPRDAVRGRRRGRRVRLLPVR